MSGKMSNKKRRLAGSTNIPRESTVNEISHSRVLRSSGKLVTFPSHALVSPGPLTLTSSGALSPEMDNPSEINFSVNTGKKKKPNMPDMINNEFSDIIHCHQPSYDGQLLDAINSETSCEAMALLTSENSFTQDGLNQALISACRRGHKQLVQTLVWGLANIEHQDEHGNTPLLICTENGFTDIVRFLVSRRANINAVNSVGNTALILSVHSAGSAHLTRFLLEQQDVDIHHENQHGHTALIRATQFMDVDTMRLLLQKSMKRNTVQTCGDVSLIRQEKDFSFYNRRSQESIQQAAVEISGVQAVYRILQDHLTTQTSPLELAINAADTKSLDIFLDCQFSSTEEKKGLIDCALKYVFKNNRNKSGERFSSTDVQIIQKLLQYGADVNQCDGSRLINLAVEAGHIQLVELLCTHGADLKICYTDEEDSSCITHTNEQEPLWIAAANGRQDLIELLLKHKADVNTFCFSYSALDCALRNDHTECVKLLIQSGAEMDVKWALRAAIDDENSKYFFFIFKNYNREVMDHFLQDPLEARNMLTSAVKNGNLEVIGQILDAGVSVNEADLHGVTPLMASKNGEVAEFLIQKGAEVNREIIDKNGNETALSHVIDGILSGTSKLELCKVLVDHGAAVNHRSREGRTPLMIAASQKDCVGLLQMLLDNGANINISDNTGNNVLMHAVMRHSGNPVFMNAVMGQNTKNVTCLIDSAMDKKSLINIQNNEGLTPLILSVQKGNVPIVKELIEKGADVNIKDNKENTALHHLLITCPLRREEILTSLLKAGSHVNCQNSDGLSPLMLATKNTLASMMSPLLDAGADVNAVSKRNKSQTAISFLPEFRHTDLKHAVLCILKLISRGALCSYFKYERFQELIGANRIRLIAKLIQHGLGPADIETNKTDFVIILSFSQRAVSPLLLALWHGHNLLARFFMSILFLTNADMAVFACNRNVLNFLQREGSKYPAIFFEQLSSRMLSLVKLCLMRVSAAVGSSPGRETRVDSLPLPQVLKDRLLFKHVSRFTQSLTV